MCFLFDLWLTTQQIFAATVLNVFINQNPSKIKWIHSTYMSISCLFRCRKSGWPVIPRKIKWIVHECLFFACLGVEKVDGLCVDKNVRRKSNTTQKLSFLIKQVGTFLTKFNMPKKQLFILYQFQMYVCISVAKNVSMKIKS